MQFEFIKEAFLFPTPLFIYRFANFEQHKEEMYRYFDLDDIWLENEKRNNLIATRANLHKETLLAPFIQFVQASLEDSMSRLGYMRDIGITSAWATKHLKDGYHHQHVHRNSFLSAVFYLRDDSGVAHGTTFHDPNLPFRQIDPPVDTNRATFFKPSLVSAFEPGLLFVFPSWASHSTYPSNSDNRIVVAFNAMPIGKTNTDHFDRYNFGDPAIMDLKEYKPL